MSNFFLSRQKWKWNFMGILVVIEMHSFAMALSWNALIFIIRRFITEWNVCKYDICYLPLYNVFVIHCFELKGVKKEEWNS